MPSSALFESAHRRRTRSVGFLDLDGTRWACFLVTYRSSASTWRGRLAFRTDSEAGIRSVSTAEIFIESAESEIDRKARQMGRPLLRALLASALEVEELTRHEALHGQEVRGWVREALRDRAHGCPWEGEPTTTDPAHLALLRSRYETYRIDQVTHLVALMEPAALESLVNETLKGQPFEFGARDRLQFAMIVVQRLEALLPLPPLEVFLEDYQRGPVEYERYRHELYDGADLP